jgi:hypothetical protein
MELWPFAPTIWPGDPMVDLTEDQFAILHHAITMARNDGVKSVSTLKLSLIRCEYEEIDVVAALDFWVEYERRKATPPSRTEMA